MKVELILIDIVVLAFLAGLQYIIINKVSKNKIENLEKEANELLDNSKKEVDSLKKEAILEAKEEVHRLRTDFEKELRERRNEVQRLERRLIQREEALDKKSEILEKKEDAISKKLQDIDLMEANAQELLIQRRHELEKISGLTSEDAKQILLEEVNR